MTMNNIFTDIGIGTAIVFGIAILSLVADFILNGIREAIWVYKYKHRFDKPPTAACYCVDCKFHGDGTDPARCTNRQNIVFRTADEWYCWAAKPKERDRER